MKKMNNHISSFDHLYAVAPSRHLDDVEMHSLMQSSKIIEQKDAEILSLKNQNSKLKKLLVHHLDLIQQQNDVIINREKSLLQTSSIPPQEANERPRVKRQSLALRNVNPPPLFNAPTTSTITAVGPSQEDSLIPPVPFSPFCDVLNEANLFSNDQQKPFEHDPFDLGRPSESLPDLQEFIAADLPSFLESNPLTPLPPDFNMIDRLTPIKEVKTPEPPPREPNYTITTNSGIPIIHKVKNLKRPSCIGSLSRMPKTPKRGPSTIYDNELYNVNKRAKMMDTHDKSKVGSLRYPYAGSLSDRLQLIDTTPTGEDPYQIGEAEMREQSPIPRLVLPKNNRVRIHTAEGFGSLTALPASAKPPASRPIYGPKAEPKPRKGRKPSKAKTNQRKGSAQISTTSALTTLNPSIKSSTSTGLYGNVNESLSWEPINRKLSFGDTPVNLPTSIVASGELVSSGEHLPSATLVSPSNIDLYSSCKLEKMDINKMSYNDIFQPEPSGYESMELEETTVEPALITAAVEPEPTLPTTSSISIAGPSTASEVADPSTAGQEPIVESQCGTESKRGGRKRALSSTSTTKREKAPPKPRATRKRGGFRGKRGSWIPVPPMTTGKPYHTALGHPDISWYLGHDPDVKKEDVEQLAENTSSNVEVPRWRTMIFTSLVSPEGTENTDDDVYRKRHQKLEAEERRQLRWHMRRVREQRQVERLRLRQRDPWTMSTQATPPTYTVWPSPLRDLQFIEITVVLPVLAFGEDIPKLPEVNFVLPWVKTSQAQKRSKRSKTLH